MPQPKTAVAFCVHDDHWFLKPAIESFRTVGDVFAFVSQKPWNGEAGEWERTKSVAEDCGAKAVVGDWPFERLHRQTAVQTLLDLGYTHAFMPDTHRIAEPRP